ncbi:helix-turn-helix domain-containing protein [Paenibacillus naphthalenovorans]|uniref:helix-turn-helix domain-containing protein n=1 Tax=Paenibacillus naphthalenovorans TaxID=162209 RepID=UPI0008835750|nr:helix-turn-helix domain-containing protein [Paenibacillus naphthalenovorans]SDJ82425.1 DNA binding domain-containing protein, excisionase family [Paenibacillus naphthalenovorans]
MKRKSHVKMDDLPDILTVKMIADLMGWHPNTVYSRCTSGELKSFKSGNSRRIRREAYLQWIAELETR